MEKTFRERKKSERERNGDRLVPAGCRKFLFKVNACKMSWREKI